MKLKNRFREADKIFVWLYHQHCAKCGSNNMCSLHHILGTESRSILNSIMLCVDCHAYADGHNVSDTNFQSVYLKYCIKEVLKSGYKFTEEDIEFYKKHHDLYVDN